MKAVIGETLYNVIQKNFWDNQLTGKKLEKFVEWKFVCVKTETLKFLEFILLFFLVFFVPNIENKPTIDHIDRNPSNNKLSNLRYATRSEQEQNIGKTNEGEPTSSYIGIYVNRKKYRALII